MQITLPEPFGFQFFFGVHLLFLSRSGFNKRGPNQQQPQQGNIQRNHGGGMNNYNRDGGRGGGMGGRQNMNNDYGRGGGDRYNSDGYNQQGRDGRDYGRDGRGNSSRSAGNNYNGTHFVLYFFFLVFFSICCLFWLIKKNNACH